VGYSVTRVITSIAALAAVYALALASIDPWDLGIGAVLGGLVVAAFRGFIFSVPALAPSAIVRRAAHFPAFALATAADIVRGTITMIRVVLSRDPSRETGFVEIPIGERSETGLAVSGIANTLSPGTVMVDVDVAAGSWTIHSIDVSDEDAVREDVQRFYDRYQRQVWP
jgi:multicomponent Na+:H+ antiporter subunit E